MALSIEQKKAQLLKKYNETNKAIKTLENREEATYHTINKYLPQIGHIHELTTLQQVVKAKKYINSESGSNADVIAELGIDADELPVEDVKLMGFPISKWNADINTKVEELRIEIKLEKLYNDASILERNLSEDDKFNLEMSELSTIEWDEEDEKDDFAKEFETE